MKLLICFILILQSITSAAQTETYLQQFKKGKAMILYSYIQRNDSLFLKGHLQEIKSQMPIAYTNIVVKNFPVGTVTNAEGNFEIYLPRKEGTITFDKTGYMQFEFAYKFLQQSPKVREKQMPKRPSAHH